MSLTNAVETELTSDGRFGDWRLILGHVYSHYTSGLDALGNSVPCAARVRCKLAEEGSARVVEELGDPGVRIALNRMLELHKAGERELAFELLPVLDAVESNLQEVRRLRFVGSNLTGLGANIEVWTSDRSGPADEIFNSAFNKEIASSVSDEAVALCDPSPAMLSTLQRGLNLLISLVPRLAVGMLAHVRMVAVIDVADVSHRFGRVRYNMCQNVSTHAIPGTIFLSPTPLENEWRAAEALLHEAMHKRLSDLVLTKSIFRTGFSSADSPTVLAVWNRSLVWNPNEWPVDRALFALHYYAQIAIFYAAIRDVPELQICHVESVPWADVHKQVETSLKKARYLCTEIEKSGLSELGEDGVELLYWLKGLVLDLSAPTHDALADLIALSLDRYDSETQFLSNLLGKTQVKFSEGVGHLVHSEIVSVFRVLSVLGEEMAPSFAYYDGDRWAKVIPRTPSMRTVRTLLISLRTYMSATIRGCNPQDLRKTGNTRRTKTLADFVLEAVEHASRHLDELLASLSTGTGKT